MNILNTTIIATILPMLFTGFNTHQIPQVKIPKEHTSIVKEHKETKNERRYIEFGEFRVTAYCPCKECSEEFGRDTSTGVKAKEGRTIAVDPTVIPYGSKVLINNKVYIAEDCGGAIKGDDIDIYFDNHEDTEKFGVKYLDVKLIKE